MGESPKAVLALVVLLAIALSILFWLPDGKPSTRTWILRLVFPLVGAGALALLCWASFRRDEVPDYLRQITKSYFDRDGFCFVPNLILRDQTCILQVLFQNRFERACEARVALAPAPGFFLTRKKILNLTLDIDCGPAAFGFAEIPLPVPLEYQGKSLKLEIGTAVRYLNGRGRRLRFRDGHRVGPVDFDSWGGHVLTIAGAFAGAVVLSHPASTTLTLPIGVKTELPDDTPVEIRTFWQLGDPPITDMSQLFKM